MEKTMNKAVERLRQQANCVCTTGQSLSIQIPIDDASIIVSYIDELELGFNYWKNWAHIDRLRIEELESKVIK